MAKIQDNQQKYITQQKKVFAAILKEPLTMLQIEKKTRVMRTNSTWYLTRWEREGLVCRVRQAVDKLTGRKVWFWSASQEICRYCQTQLFDK